MSQPTSTHPVEAPRVPIGGDKAMVQMPGLGPSGTVIAVMGVTGSGKSTFISQLVGEKAVAVGHGLHSGRFCPIFLTVPEHCPPVNAIYLTRYHGNPDTKVTRAYEFHRPGQDSVHVVDTPGFDDTYASDVDVLFDIAAFMAMIYKSSVKLAGIIYLHRITDNRFGDSAARSLRMLKQLCGQGAYKHVMLVTSMWNRLPEGDMIRATERESQLVSESDIWKDMHERGSPVKRWYANRASATEIVNDLLAVPSSNGGMCLKIQRELIDDGQTLERTLAGIAVTMQLAERNKYLESGAKRTMEASRMALAKGQSKRYEELEIERAASEEDRRRVVEAEEALKADSEMLIEKNAKKYREEEEKAKKKLDAARRSIEELNNEIKRVNERNRQLQEKLDSMPPESEKEEVVKELEDGKKKAEDLINEKGTKEEMKDALKSMLDALTRITRLALSAVGVIRNTAR